MDDCLAVTNLTGENVSWKFGEFHIRPNKVRYVQTFSFNTRGKSLSFVLKCEQKKQWLVCYGMAWQSIVASANTDEMATTRSTEHYTAEREKFLPVKYDVSAFCAIESFSTVEIVT